MNNLHITCDNLEQRQNVFNVLDGMGYTIIIHNKNRENYGIQTDKNSKEAIQWVADFYLDETTQLTYTQFMEQYSMQALRNTIKNSGLSNPELSIKLGHSRKYLTNLLSKGCSTAMQNQLIEEINQVMAGTFKTDAEVIAELTEKLSNAQDLAKFRLAALQHQQTECTKLSKANASLTEESDKYHTENQTLRKNAQNHDIVISEHQATITHLTAQLNQSRETMSKQSALNESLNGECAELAEKLGFKTKEWVELGELLALKNRNAVIQNIEIKKLRQSQKIHRLLSLACLATIILLIVIKWGV